MGAPRQCYWLKNCSLWEPCGLHGTVFVTKAPRMLDLLTHWWVVWWCYTSLVALKVRRLSVATHQNSQLKFVDVFASG
jgi:hypothetical protein